MSQLSDFSLSHLLLVMVFVVPGAVSITVFRLLQPSPDRTLKDVLLESIVASIINFIILFLPIYYAIDPETIRENTGYTWGILIICLLVAPILWPVLYVKSLSFLNKRGKVVAGSPTAWGDFFTSHSDAGCWIIAHLNGGRTVQ